MRILLDTNVVIWMIGAPKLLSQSVLDLIVSEDTAIHLSAINVLEIGIKRASGKLRTPGDPLDEVRGLGGTELPVSFEHAARSAALPRHHGDPFDRILVAQAQLEQLALVTSDQELAAYDVEILPALA